MVRAMEVPCSDVPLLQVSWQPLFAARSGPTSVHAEALLPTGCSQPMTELRGCTGAGYLASHWRLYQATLVLGFPAGWDFLRAARPSQALPSWSFFISLSFTCARPASCLMAFPDYSWFLSPLFSQPVPCNKSLALWIPSWCLLPGESKITQTFSKHSSVHLCFVYSCHSVQPRCFRRASSHNLLFAYKVLDDQISPYLSKLIPHLHQQVCISPRGLLLTCQISEAFSSLGLFCVCMCRLLCLEVPSLILCRANSFSSLDLNLNATSSQMPFSDYISHSFWWEFSQLNCFYV